MKNNLHIITGASKGLGYGIAKYLADKGDQVVSISRTKGPFHPLIRTIETDLSQKFSASELISSIFTSFAPHEYNQISLVNNAGMIDPIGPIGALSESQIQKDMDLNLFAPISLTNAFLAQTTKHSGTKMILMVSSGVAKNPKAYWSVYSSAKAGLEAFTAALQKEMVEKSNTRIVCYNPGIMDTDMQATIRATTDTEFPERARFVGFKTNGDLIDPIRAGALTARVVLGELAKDKSDVSISDLLTK